MNIENNSYPPDSDNAMFCMPMLLIPDAEDGNDSLYGIKPGLYDRNGLVGLLRAHRTNPNAIQYIADMLDE